MHDSPESALAAAPTVSEARLMSVLNTAVDGIIVVDEQARILVYNKACEKLFGYSAAEILGQNVRSIMPRDYAEAHNRYMHNYMATGQRKIIGIGREVRARHKDGTEFPVELSVGEASTPDGRQFIGILRDLRSRKEAEQRVNDLQAELVHLARVSAMDEMGAALAHELNQPLTAIMLYMQAIARSLEKRSDPADATFKTVLAKAVHEAERAGNIISRMRQFVEKREPNRRPIDLNNVVDEAVELTLVGLRSRVAIERQFAPRLPKAFVEPVQVQQIVVNLLRNAAEVLKERDDGLVIVSTGQDGAYLTITVEDNGPGIPPAAMPNLFKAFATTKTTGMGLGLSISRSIAQNHSGDLVVDPGGHGRGARFTVQLPAASREEDAASAP
jgi:two-component system, LuxR family, sensor kinase FixL